MSSHFAYIFPPQTDGKDLFLLEYLEIITWVSRAYDLYSRVFESLSRTNERPGFNWCKLYEELPEMGNPI